MINRLPISLSATSLSCNTHAGSDVTFSPADFYNEWSNLAKKHKLSLNYAIWDHGDGTFSKALTSKHQYIVPGIYNAKLIVYDSAGTQHRSTSAVSITATDYINNDLVWANSSEIFNIPASTKKWYPIHIDVYNSWQTYPQVADKGYTLHLHASGSFSEKLNVSEFYKDKWSHLRNIWTFHRTITSGGIEYLAPIEDYNLKDITKTLYLSSYSDNNSIKQQLVTAPGPSAIFVGTSARATVYYYDETPRNFSGLDDPILLFASLDTRDFLNSYAGIKGDIPTTLDLATHKTVQIPVRIRSSYSSSISINGNGIPTFTLPKDVWVGSHIPFFLCYTDVNNNAKENYPPLEITKERVYARNDDLNKIRLTLTDKAGAPVAADFISGGWSDELPEKLSGYYRGYIIPREPADDVTLKAEAYTIDKITADREFYNAYFVSPVLSAIFFVNKPAKRLTYSDEPQIGYTKVNVKLADETDVIDHEVYPICVVPDMTIKGSTFDRSHVFVGDSYSRSILHLDYNGKKVRQINTIKDKIEKHFPQNAASLTYDEYSVDPVISRITADSDTNMWVSVYDSLSSFKINTEGEILDTITNIDLSKYEQSGPFYKYKPTGWDPNKDSSLKLYFSFDGQDFSNTVNDDSGNRNDAEVYEAKPVVDRFENKNGAYKFAGTRESYIQKLGIEGFNFHIGNEMSMMCWFKLDSGNTGHNGVIAMNGKLASTCSPSHAPHNIYENNRSTMEHNNGKANVCDYRMMVSPNMQPYWNAGQHADKEVANLLPGGFKVDRWYHYALTVKGGGAVAIYVDGVKLDVPNNGSGVPANLPDVRDLHIGQGEQPDAHPFKGDIDEVRIYNRALTDAEITSVYNYDGALQHVSNIGTPVSIETDVFDNVWVAYDSLSKSYLRRYSKDTKLVQGFDLKPGQFIYDIQVANDNNLWVSTYYDRGTRPLIRDLTSPTLTSDTTGDIEEIIVTKTPGFDAKVDVKMICNKNFSNGIQIPEFHIAGFPHVVEIANTHDHYLNTVFLTEGNAGAEQLMLSADNAVNINPELAAAYEKYPPNRNVIAYRMYVHPCTFHHHSIPSKKVRWSGHVNRYDNFENPGKHLEDEVMTVQDGRHRHDSDWDKVKLLIRAEDGITDLSQSGHTITTEGGVSNDEHIDMAKFGLKTIRFDGNDDYLTMPASDDWNFGTDDFTIEMWLHPNHLGGQSHYSHYFAIKDQYTFALKSVPGYWYLYGTNGAGGSQPLASTNGNAGPQDYLNKWVHLVLTRVNGRFKIFVNGVLKSHDWPANDNIPVGSSTEKAFIGHGWSNEWLEADLDQIRITKGVARYKNNFTPNNTPMGSTDQPMHASLWHEYISNMTPIRYTEDSYSGDSCMLLRTHPTTDQGGGVWTGKGTKPAGANGNFGGGVYYMPGVYGSKRPESGKKYRISFWTKGLKPGAHGVDSSGHFVRALHWSNQNGGGDSNNLSFSWKPKLNEWKYVEHEAVLNTGGGWENPNMYTPGGPKRYAYIVSTNADQHVLIDEFRFEEIPIKPVTDATVQIKEPDEIKKWDWKNQSELKTYKGVLYPTYLAIDLNKRVWVTNGNNILTRIHEDPILPLQSANVLSYYIGENTPELVPLTYNMNLQFQNHDGIAVNMSNELYVLDNFFRKIYVVNSDTGAQIAETPILTKPTEKKLIDLASQSWPSTDNLYYQGVGDWNGVRWFHKYRNNAVDVKRITGETTMNISPASGKYHLRKINENFDPQETIKTYRMQENLVNSDRVFETFIGQAIGTLSSTPDSIGKKFYEKAANFSSNHIDVNECTVDSLKSLAALTNIDIDGSYNYTYPSDIRRVVDFGTIPHKDLWGSRSKYVRNFYAPMSAVNLGTEIDPTTYMVTPGVPFIAHELFSDTHILIVPKFLNEDLAVDLKYNKIEEYAYPLSTYGMIVKDGETIRWPWSWSLDETITGSDIGFHYQFYNYVHQPSNIYKEGVINWNDPHTTVLESNSTLSAWETKDGILDNMIEHQLRSSLDLFSTEDYKIPTYPYIKSGVYDTGVIQSGRFSVAGNIIATGQTGQVSTIYAPGETTVGAVAAPDTPTYDESQQIILGPTTEGGSSGGSSGGGSY